MRNNGEVRNALTKLSESVESIIPKGKSVTKTNGDIGDLVEQEMLGAAKAIEAAMQRLQQLMARPRDTGRSSAVDLQVHDSILSAAMAITNAIARLIKAATDSQQEIVAQGKGANSTGSSFTCVSEDSRSASRLSGATSTAPNRCLPHSVKGCSAVFCSN